MAGKVVPVRLDRELLEFIDELLRLGVSKSRSEIIRMLAKAGAERYRELSDVSRAVEKLFEVERKTGRIPVELRGGVRELLEREGEDVSELCGYERACRRPRPRRP